MVIFKRYVPERQAKAIETQQFLSAAPRIGHPSNYAFNACQVNPSVVTDETDRPVRQTLPFPTRRAAAAASADSTGETSM